MGWGGASRIFNAVIDAIQPEISDAARRKALYLKLIPSFEDGDWDTQAECLGRDPAYDDALTELHPDWDSNP